MSHKRSRKAQRRRQTRTWAECAHEKTEFKLANIQSSWPNPDNALIKPMECLEMVDVDTTGERTTRTWRNRYSVPDQFTQSNVWTSPQQNQEHRSELRNGKKAQRSRKHP